MLAGSDVLLSKIVKDNADLLLAGSSGVGASATSSSVYVSTASSGSSDGIAPDIRVDTIPSFPYTNLIRTMENSFSPTDISKHTGLRRDNTDAGWKIDINSLFSDKMNGIIISKEQFANTANVLSVLLSRMSELNLYSDEELNTVLSLKPFFNGNAIKDMFHNIGDRTNIGVILNAEIVWQLDHPAGSADACLEYLKRTFNAFC